MNARTQVVSSVSMEQVGAVSAVRCVTIGTGNISSDVVNAMWKFAKIAAGIGLDEARLRRAWQSNVAVDVSATYVSTSLWHKFSSR